MNVVHCPCDRSYRFRRHSRGHVVYVLEKPLLPWRKSDWKVWGEWASTIEKFRCKCGRNLRT